MTVTIYGGSDTSYAENQGAALGSVTGKVYKDLAMTQQLTDLRDSLGNVTNVVTTSRNGHYKFGVNGWNQSVYVDFGLGPYLVYPADMAERLAALEVGIAGAVTTVNGEAGAVVLSASDVGAISASAIGATVVPIGTDGKIPDQYVPVQQQFKTFPLGDVAPGQTIVADISLYSDFTMRLVGGSGAVPVVRFAAIANPAFKGTWTFQIAEDSAGGHAVDLQSITGWPGAGTGVAKATALAPSTVAGSATEYLAVTRDGGATQTVRYITKDVLPITSLDATILALSPTYYHRLNDASGTSLAEANGGAAGTIAGTGALVAQAASTPTDPTGKALVTTKTGYATLPTAVGNLTTGFCIAIPVHGDDIGADWVSTGSVAGLGAYCEGRSTDTAHNQAALMVASGKNLSWKARVLIRIVVNGTPVDIIGGTGQDECSGVLWDGRDRYAILNGTPVDATHFRVDLIIDGVTTDSWTFDPTGATFNPNIASLGAFVRGDVSTGQWAKYEKVARWTHPLTSSQISTLVAAWKGSRVNGRRVWPSGAFVNNGSSTALDNFGAMRGRPADRVIIFNSATTWADIESIANIHPSYRTASYQGVNSSKLYYSVVGLPFGDSTQTLTQGANGDYDIHFTNLANNLKAAGFTQPCIRVLEEPDLTSGYWPHGIANASNAARNYAGGLSQGQVFANYRTYFQRIVKAMRAVLPLATFDFSTQVIAYGWERYYPGDAVVDRITPDLYDIDWDQNILPNVETSSIRLRKLMGGNGNNGMLFLSRFILPGASRLDDSPGAGTLTTNTKRLTTGLTEWGLANKEWGADTSTKGGGGGDDPDFVDLVMGWCQAKGVGDVSGVGHELYFEYGTGAAGTYGPRHWISPQSVDDKPLSRDRYKFWMNA